MPKNWRSDKGVSTLFLAKVKCAGVDANAAQVKHGMAWVYRQYARVQNLYILEHDAKAERRGLWIDISPTPPWAFRKLKRHASTQVMLNE